MNLGLSNITNMYYQRYINQQNKTISQNNGIDFSSTLSAKKAENMNMAQATEETEPFQKKWTRKSLKKRNES